MHAAAQGLQLLRYLKRLGILARFLQLGDLLL